jgi:regulator of sigma E protease
VALLSFTGIISVNLALVNIIPFPPLDGSRVVLLGVEAIIGQKKLNKFEGKILNVGMAILLILILGLTLSEIPKLISAGSISGFVDSLMVE